MRKLQVGIIGCGGFGNYHLDNLLHLQQEENVNIAALAAGNREKLEQTGRKAPQAKLYSRWQDMLESNEIDVAFVCVTPGRHEDIEEIAAAHGVSLYIEKPLGLQMKQVKDKLSAIEQSNILVSVGYQERYSQAMQKAREALAGKRVRLVLGKWIGSMPGVAWWRRQEQSGGQLVEQCTHIVDALRFLLGEVEEVFCTGGAQVACPDGDVAECSSATLRFAGGTLASLLTGCFMADGAPDDIGFTVYAEDVRIEDRWGREILVATAQGQQRYCFDTDWHVTAVKAFLRAVREQDPAAVLSDYADAARTLAVTLALNRSMESGKLEKPEQI